jgi:hypothetical protein
MLEARHTLGGLAHLKTLRLSATVVLIVLLLAASASF